MSEPQYLSRRAVCRVGDVIWVDAEFPEVTVTSGDEGGVYGVCVTTGQRLRVTGIYLESQPHG